jgi:GDP/UDP-N,N'-diacetylbacillosamine 2-epimerase (hydrolysing)
MKIGVLTSSRADFGIYLPLLRALKVEAFFEVEIIVFGTHMSYYHGHTIDDIIAQGFEATHKLETMLLTDSASSLSSAIGLTFIKFGDFWSRYSNYFDLVFCLGDRYEMYAAVMAGVPFQIPFAHIHGGETTLGAIDNIFRHGITLASKYHFVSTESYAKRVGELIQTDQNIYYVGALSLDNISQIKKLTVAEFKDKWGIDLDRPTVLTTFHPETVNFNSNEVYTDELIKAINNLNTYQFLITMPNADTMGTLVRQKLINEFKGSSRVFLIENLGAVSYFTAMSYCAFLLGNTSSGIIEAASFGKYVINLGERQLGRAADRNVFTVKIDSKLIIEAVNKIENAMPYTSQSIYYNGGAATKIINVLKGYLKQ